MTVMRQIQTDEVPIIGAEHLSHQALDFINMCLERYPHKLKCVFIDVEDNLDIHEGDGVFTKISGWHDFKTRSITLNMHEIFRQSLRRTQPDECGKYCAFMTELWMRFTVVMLHEMRHEGILHEKGIEKYQDVPEDDVIKWSLKEAVDMGKTISMEPPQWPEERFFSELFNYVLNEAANDKDKEDWYLFQQNCLDNGLTYHDEDRDIELKTYHDVQRMMSDDPKDKTWNEDLVVLTPTKEQVATEMATSVIQLPAHPIVPPQDVTTTVQLNGMDDGECDASMWDVMEEMVGATPNFPNQNTQTPPTNQTFNPTPNFQTQTAAMAPTNQTFNAGPNFQNQNVPAQPMNQTFNSTPNYQTPTTQQAQGNQTSGQPQYQATPITDGPALPAEITPDMWQQAVYQIYNRCWEMIFQCGWQPDNDNAFSNLGHIIEHPLPIEDIPYAQQIIVGMDCTNPDGVQNRQAPVTTFIRGKLGKAGRPSYVLYLNYFGKITKRTIIAVNPNTGSNLSMASRVKRNALIWNNNMPDSAKFYEKCPVQARENNAGNVTIIKTPITQS